MGAITAVQPPPEPVELPPATDSPTDKAMSPDKAYRLSRFVSLRPTKEGLLAESLLSGRWLLVPNAAGQSLLLTFLSPVRPGDLLASLDQDKRPAVSRFLERCHEYRLLTAVDDDGETDDDRGSLAHWEFHDLLFHVRSRQGRNPAPVGATYHLVDKVAPEPAFKTGPKAAIIPLERPPANDSGTGSPSLTETLENRRSRYGVEPLDLASLGEFLYRTCRVTGQKKTDDGDLLLKKLHPSGGSFHSLEVYVVPRRCPGLSGGLYHYRALEHALTPVADDGPEVEELLREAQQATGVLPDLPSVLFIISARFRRVSRKYQSLAYRIILKEVGALFQTMYLVATAMELSPCALGSGDSDRFARVTGTDYYRETSVGEFILGGKR